MRYVQLRAFHYVAICGGFSRAAECLHLTQPAISDQVRKLEEDYDVLLLNRQKKQVSLTRSGNRLLEITHRLFEVEKQAQELLSESRDLRSGSLRIIADSANHLLQVLGKFREQFPGIEISIRSGNTEDVIAALHDYQADIGVLGEVPEGTKFRSIKLSSTPLIAFVSKQNKLSNKRSLTLAELFAQPLVLRERGSKTRQKLEDVAAERDLPLKAAIEAEGREAVQQIVDAGVGFGIVSAAEFVTQPNLVPIEISDCEILMDEALICLRERAAGKMVRTFLDLAGSWQASEDLAT